MRELILGIILGIAVAILVYETIAEQKQKQIRKLISQSLIDILEGSTMRIGERAKILKRELTEEEKDKVIDEFYKDYKEMRE